MPQKLKKSAWLIYSNNYKSKVAEILPSFIILNFSVKIKVNLDRISKVEFEFQLDDFQLEACDYITNKCSVVLCAPTGAGKTVIAEHAIHLALKEGKRVFYTTPLKALSNQKFYDFSKKFGEDKTGLLTGDTSINRSAQIVVMTTEVFRNILYGTNFGKVDENLKNVEYVVLDEVHYMNDEQRGTVWEESIIYCPSNIKIIALSATVANAQELTDWINTVHSDTRLVYTDFRPVPLRFYYYSPSSPFNIYSLFTPDGRMNSKIRPEKKQKTFNKNKTKFHVPLLIEELNKKDMLPAIYFAFSRSKCDDYMEECSKLDLLGEFEKRRLNQIIDEYILENPYLAKNKHLECLYSGVASHHAGLLPAWKGLVEKLFQQGLIKVVFATETLAAGINMPARTTIISAISKRGDKGHRNLTANEFLQMSGRAGRRGMDQIGHVVVVGSGYNTPEEVALLASAKSDDLESRFTPGYSMVLNLLQRFSLDEAKELILKSFGYYSSNKRLNPLLTEKKRIQGIISDIDSFACPYGQKFSDITEFNKIKNMYVEHRNLTKILRKQAKQPNAPEVIEFEKKTKDLLNQMYEYQCCECKRYKKHLKDIEIKARFVRKMSKIDDDIKYEKDIYWKTFLNHAAVLEETGYLLDNYPSEDGLVTSMLRTENELFFSEIIFSGLLNDLEPSELASVICAVITEEVRNKAYLPLKVSKKVRKTLSDIEQILRKVWKIQKKYNIEKPLLLNPYYSPLIENWVNGQDWDDLTVGIDVPEGDIVRTFKRTVDLLRQLTMLSKINPELAKNAGYALECINREPVKDAF